MPLSEDLDDLYELHLHGFVKDNTIQCQKYTLFYFIFKI